MGKDPALQAAQLDAIITTLTGGGPRTARQLATDMGIAYPTLTPRLRQLEDGGRTERFTDPDSRRTLWRATEPGADNDPAANSEPAAASPSDADPPDPEPGPADIDASAKITNASNDLSVDEPTDETTDQDDPRAVETDQTPADPTAPARRRKGEVAAAILAILRAHADTAYKISTLHKETGISAGALANSAHKLVTSGEVLLIDEAPLTIQAA